ncbi:MAG: hypothetical protein ABIO49_09280 [Dokdonella sp.]
MLAPRLQRELSCVCALTHLAAAASVDGFTCRGLASLPFEQAVIAAVRELPAVIDALQAVDIVDHLTARQHRPAPRTIAP